MKRQLSGPRSPGKGLLVGKVHPPKRSRTGLCGCLVAFRVAMVVRATSTSAAGRAHDRAAVGARSCRWAVEAGFDPPPACLRLLDTTRQAFAWLWHPRHVTGLWHRWLTSWEHQGRTAGWMAIAYVGGALLWLVYAVVTGSTSAWLTGLTWIVFGAIFVLLFSRSRRKGSP